MAPATSLPGPTPPAVRPSLARRVVRVAGVAVAAAGGLWQLSLEARLFAGRFRYPWDIEWLESSWLYQAYRSMHGMSTYGPPKEGYLPPLHPPLYPAALGVIGRVVGLDYAMARTVAFLLFLSASALVVRGLVKKHEGRLEGWALGALAIGCAAAGAPLVEGFYDLVRGDLMAVALAVLAASLVGGPRRMSTRRLAAVAAVLTSIVYTRLPAVFFPVWIVIFVFARHPRTGVLLALTTAAACGLVLVALQWASHGWYWMYTVSLLQDHQILGARFALGLKMVATFAPFVVAVPVLAIALAVKGRLSAQGALWMGMLVAAIAASLLPFAKVGGFANDFMPIAFLLGPATAFVVSDALSALERHPRVMLATATLLFAGGAAFLYVRTWDFKRWVPPEETFRRARALNARVASLQGGVIAPRHPFLPIHNGDTALQWNDMAYLDMLWAGFTDLNLGAYIDRGHARYALISGTEVPNTMRELSTRYQLEERLVDPPVTLIGERSVMRYLLRLNDEEKDGRVLFDFESLDGWTVTGDAFILTTPRPVGQSPIQGALGKHLANSFNPKGKDPARGTLTSPKFVIDRPRMSLRIGGGQRHATRVELRVGGRMQRTATPIFEYNETLVRVVWDVSALQGKEAQLVLIDEDAGSWGHLMCDHVVVY